jgi:pimeloyl-ACP methyl ester carboxylesterase
MHAGIRAHFAASGATTRTPIVFVHGGAHTGACYIETPDGRIGWAPYLAQRGREAYVYDWPGRGARAAGSDFTTLSLGDVARDLADVLAEIGPAVLVTHSMGGVVGWRTAELARTNVAAIVAIAPGPPANLQPSLDAAAIADLQRDDAAYARAGRPLAHPEHAPIVTPRAVIEQMWMNSTHFPREAADAYLATVVPESPRAMNERNNIGGSGIAVAGPEVFDGLPIVVITGDEDPRHPRETDEAIADYVGGEFIWLPDIGLPGHGHMQMIERGNLAIADVIECCLEERGR